jgi:hypothetical protein
LRRDRDGAAPSPAEPALPLDDEAGLETSPDELKQVRGRMERDKPSVIALRLRDAPYCKAGRFASCAAALGGRFGGQVLPDESADRDVAPFFARQVPSPHCVVTENLVDRAGEPTLRGRDPMLVFLAERLERGRGASAATAA